MDQPDLYILTCRGPTGRCSMSFDLGNGQATSLVLSDREFAETCLRKLIAEGSIDASVEPAFCRYSCAEVLWTP